MRRRMLQPDSRQLCTLLSTLHVLGHYSKSHAPHPQPEPVFLWRLLLSLALSSRAPGTDSERFILRTSCLPMMLAALVLLSVHVQERLLRGAEQVPRGPLLAFRALPVSVLPTTLLRPSSHPSPWLSDKEAVH